MGTNSNIAGAATAGSDLAQAGSWQTGLNQTQNDIASIAGFGTGTGNVYQNSPAISATPNGNMLWNGGFGS